MIERVARGRIARAALLTTVVVSSAAAQQSDTSFAYFASGSRPVVLLRDSIGVYAPGVSDTAVVHAAVASWGGHHPRNLGNGLFVVALPQPVTRALLPVRARTAIAQGGNVIRQAGFIVRKPGDPGRESIIASDQFLVEFRPGITLAQIDSLNLIYSVRIVTRRGLLRNDYILTVTPGSPGDVLLIANKYHESQIVVFAHPNYLDPYIQRSVFPDDPLFPDQWHLHNTGTLGKADADIDAPEAWDLTIGLASVVIAIIEPMGFDRTHPDLFPNLWINPNEMAGNGADESDPWAKKDDVNGWDFYGCVLPTTTPQLETCGSPISATRGGRHGTSVAGLAAARGGNATGVTGVCQKCSIMLVSLDGSDNGTGAAIQYAWEMGASVLNMSWRSSVYVRTSTQYAINKAIAEGRGTKGALVVMAGSESDNDSCADEFYGVDDAIVVIGSDNYDRRATWSGHGSCVDIMAPGWMANMRGVKGLNGTTYAHVSGIGTTDSVGTGGYNSHDPERIGCQFMTESLDLSYTRCFSGTSAAAPIVSGVIGLMLSVNPSLDDAEVRAILYKTADRIEFDPSSCPSNPAGYSPACPITTSSWSPTHGNGRVNAFAAVKEANGGGGSGSGGSGSGGSGGCAWCEAPGAVEIGVRMGVVFQSDAFTRTIVAVPGNGPLAAPSIYATWFPSGPWMLELHLGGFSRTGGGLPKETELDAAVQAGYMVPVGAAALYGAGSFALRRTEVTPYPSVTETGLGAAIGFRYKPVPFAAIRVEALARRWTGLSINEFGIALALGVVF